MSLTISPLSSHASLVANAGSLQLLSVSAVTANLRGEFWELATTTQVHTVRSACHYLQAVGAEEEVLANGREFLQNREERAEPNNLQYTTFRLAWGNNLKAIQGRFPETDDDAASVAVASVQEPAPPPPSASPRLAIPLLAANAHAAAGLVDGDRAAAAASEDDEDRKFFPPLWWELSQPTRWGLKHIALGTKGKTVHEQIQDDETHAQFLGSALTKWFGDIKEALADDGKPRVRDLLDRLGMATEVLEFFRREERRVTSLGRSFWKGLSENSGVRMATRPLGRLQSAVDEDVRARLSAAIAHVELGVVESLIMPLYEGEQSPNDFDGQQGTEAAQKFSQHLKGLPLTARTDLDADQVGELSAADSVLREVGQKMRGDAGSAYATAFFRELGAEVIYLAAIAEMIRQRLRRREEAVQAPS